MIQGHEVHANHDLRYALKQSQLVAMLQQLMVELPGSLPANLPKGF